MYMNFQHSQEIIIFFVLLFVVVFFSECEGDYRLTVVPLVLGFTASSAVVGGASDVFVSSGNEWCFAINQKAGVTIPSQWVSIMYVLWRNNRIILELSQDAPPQQVPWLLSLTTFLLGITIDQTSHLLPSPNPIPQKVMFISEEINIGISSKAYAFSHMMHEKLGSKSTHSLYTFIKSEVRKWQS